jgi:basic amino acid/polyamine antiporter, APA family
LGHFEKVLDLTVFAEWLFYALAASTVFVYRRKLPDAIRPYRVWGYPVLPAIFVGSAAVALVASYAGNMKGSLIATALILSGLKVMWLIRKERMTH